MFPQRPAASVLGFAPLHFRRSVTRPVSYYALFKGWLLLSQPPGCLRDATSFPTQPRFRDLSGRSGLFPSRRWRSSPTVQLRGTMCRHSEFGWGWYPQWALAHPVLYLRHTPTAGSPSSDFGENQLSPGSFGISPLPTGHPSPLQRTPVRASTRFYPRFTLPMGRSPGFGSTACDLSPFSDSLSLRLRVSLP